MTRQTDREAGDVEPRECWHVVADDRLMELLRRAHAGEDPDLLYIEEYVNAERETVDGEDAS
jgi:hypothetical protein